MNFKINKLILLGLLTGASLGAQANTLVHTFEGSVNLTIPDQYSDLYGNFASNPNFNRFWGTIVVPDYNNYQVGTHVIGLNTNGLQLSLVNGLLTGIEGTRTPVTTPNPAYDPSLPTCTSRQGCDLDGDGVRETPRGNLPTVSLGQTFVPDATQTGSEGSVTIVDGVLTSFD
jgi:hypothetical protein